MVSLKEIGPDLMSLFICKMLMACAEQKKDSIKKTWNMIKKLRKEFFPIEILKAGYVIVCSLISSRLALFLTDCDEEGLFSEFPLTSFVLGQILGDLILEMNMSVTEVSKMLDAFKQGRVPDSSKIFSSIIDRMREKTSDRDVVAFFGDFNLKSLWEREEDPNQDTFDSWILKSDIQFLLDGPNDDDDDDEYSNDDDEDGVSDDIIIELLQTRLGDSPISDVIAEIVVFLFLFIIRALLANPGVGLSISCGY